MLHLVVAALCFALVQDAAPSAGASVEKSDGKSELVALAKKLEAATSYTFTFKATSNAKGKEKEEDERPWTLSFQRGQALHCVKGHADFYRESGRYVALGRNDAWTKVELPPKTEGEPARGEKLRGLARMAFEIDRMPFPHELLAALDAKVTDVVRTEKDGKLDFVAQLTKETAREMLGGKPPKNPPTAGETPAAKPTETGEPGEPPQEGGADGTPSPPAAPGPAWAGVMHVVATTDGIERIELDLQSRIPSGERKVHREFEISAVDSTEVKVPEPAAKLLAQE